MQKHRPLFFLQNEFNVGRRPFPPTPTPPIIAVAAWPTSLRMLLSVGQTTSRSVFFTATGRLSPIVAHHTPSWASCSLAHHLRFSAPQSQPGRHGPYVPRPTISDSQPKKQIAFRPQSQPGWFSYFLWYIYKFRIQLLIDNI
jgi:hypothetical protein